MSRSAPNEVLARRLRPDRDQQLPGNMPSAPGYAYVPDPDGCARLLGNTGSLPMDRWHNPGYPGAMGGISALRIPDGPRQIWLLGTVA
jgi:hypothetical protein